MFRNRGGGVGFKHVSVAFLLETRNSNSVSLSDLQIASPKSTVLVFLRMFPVVGTWLCRTWLCGLSMSFHVMEISQNVKLVFGT